VRDPARQMQDVHQELLALPENMNLLSFFTGLSEVRVVHVVNVFCAMLGRALFVLLSLFFWSVYCLSVFDLRLPNAPLVT
jgi:hypothetical protein